jgi:hypothetical protein
LTIFYLKFWDHFIKVNFTKQATVSDPVDKPIEQKKRGRKPKATIALNEDETPKGRPPMAKGALEFENQNVRRSQRNKK